jgi:hypothetical protein
VLVDPSAKRGFISGLAETIETIVQLVRSSEPRKSPNQDANPRGRKDYRNPRLMVCSQPSPSSLAQREELERLFGVANETVGWCTGGLERPARAMACARPAHRWQAACALIDRLATSRQ